MLVGGREREGGEERGRSKMKASAMMLHEGGGRRQRRSPFWLQTFRPTTLTSDQLWGCSEVRWVIG